ncbi:MAG TPA: hypothetical protein VFU76_00950, partial [Terriglobales bacterium]|nr:hypothetical protein [Terriglobales bacterium]
MIGVVANPSEHAILREFFQLFKTPWEFYRRGVNYDVLLAIGDEQLPSEGAALVILYAGQKLRWDAEKGIEVTAESKPAWAEFEQSRFPLYGDSVALGRETVRIV